MTGQGLLDFGASVPNPAHRCGVCGKRPPEVASLAKVPAPLGWVCPLCSSPARPFQRHSPTSEAAAVNLRDEHIRTARARVLGWWQGRGIYGGTDDECQVALDMNPSTQRPRRIELSESKRKTLHAAANMPLVKTAWKRPTRTGAPAAVYVAREYFCEAHRVPQGAGGGR